MKPLLFPKGASGYRSFQYYKLQLPTEENPEPAHYSRHLISRDEDCIIRCYNCSVPYVNSFDLSELKKYFRKTEIKIIDMLTNSNLILNDSTNWVF